MRVVADAGPLIHLSWIDLVQLLRELFGEIVVPRGVQDEILLNLQRCGFYISVELLEAVQREERGAS